MSNRWNVSMQLKRSKFDRCSLPMAPQDAIIQTMHSDTPTLKGTLHGLSDAVGSRWRVMQGIIDKDDYSKPRYDPHPDVGQHASSGRDRPGASSVCQPQGQRPDRPSGHNGISWYQIARDFVSVGRALWPPGDQAPRWPVDDNYDKHRPVDFSSL